jgi:hypothetical protein
MKVEEYNLDFTVTLTAEDSKFTDEVVAAGVPLIVVCMFRDALRKLVAAEREACAELCIELAPSIKTTTAYKVLHEASKKILARGQA